MNESNQIDRKTQQKNKSQKFLKKFVQNQIFHECFSYKTKRDRFVAW